MRSFCRFGPSCLFFAMAASRQFVDISDDDLVRFLKKMKIPQRKQDTLSESSVSLAGPSETKCHVKRRIIILEYSIAQSQSQ